jgi:cytochrome c oxidase subunit 2
VFFAIVVLVQITRVSELLAEIKNQDVTEVTDNDNKNQGILFLIIGMGFLAFVVWQMIEWNHLLLPEAASAHGVQIDMLMDFTMGLILLVFFVLSPMLFYFAYKYRGNKNNTAYFFSHSNKLELIWTIIPTIVLTGVIIFGLKTWDQVMNSDTSDAQIIELYSQQFEWTARFAGDDNILGKSNYTLVNPENQNPLGVDIKDPNSLDDKVTREVHLVVR